MSIIPSAIEVGTRIGRLTVIGQEFSTRNNNGRRSRFAVCECDCGGIACVRSQHLRRRNAVLSCGCLRKELIGSRRRTHGNTGSRLHRIWKGTRQRCNNPKARSYARYGGVGIVICKEWESFLAFRDWALANGYRNELTLDRIKNELGYSPDNCRWVTYAEQNNNKTGNRMLTAFGETKSLAAWSRDSRCAISRGGLAERLSLGWSFEDALTMPRDNGLAYKRRIRGGN